MNANPKPLLPVKLPAPHSLSVNRYSTVYLPNEMLEGVIYVMLFMGQPLLLTSEPGAGKTQLADYLAHKLLLTNVLKFNTKSSSTARDLFYVYDALGRFHASQLSKWALQDGLMPSKRPQDYMTYHALGKAILLTHPIEKVQAYLPADFEHTGPQRSVVLIDDIDKASRDFPNDILNEMEAMYFRIPELGHVLIEADPRYQPILVITSRSEKQLPDAFLRRCICYHIPFPAAQVETIVEARMEEVRDLKTHSVPIAKSEVSGENAKAEVKPAPMIPTSIEPFISDNSNGMIVANDQTQPCKQPVVETVTALSVPTVPTAASEGQENDWQNTQLQLIQALTQFIQVGTFQLERLKALQLLAQDLLDKLNN